MADIMIIVKIGDTIFVEAEHGKHYTIHDAPNGGRTENNGPIHTTPFAFVSTGGTAVDGGFTLRKLEAACVGTVTLGEQFEIEGYGVHFLEQPVKWSTELRTIRVADGFKS